MLSPSLFTLYTSDFQFNSESAQLQRLPDNSAVVGYITGGQGEHYTTLVRDFVEHSKRNHLLLIVAKTREMGIGLRKKKKMAKQPLNILGEVIEVVEDYKYLGVHINSNLNWKTKTETQYKKTSLGSLDPLACAAGCRTFSTSLFLPVHCSLLWSAGEAALEAATQTD